MSDKPIPTELNLHRRSGVLDIVFNTQERFSLSAEYLRVFSPSAEVRGHGPNDWTWAFGKETVKIASIEPVGNYAVTLHFDDGHNTGIYTWETLHELGVHHEDYWQRYLDACEAAGRPRRQDA